MERLIAGGIVTLIVGAISAGFGVYGAFERGQESVVGLRREIDRLDERESRDREWTVRLNAQIEDLSAHVGACK